MAKNIELLLIKTVENLGIVGDVVRVKAGLARNYLLPMGLAEPPHPAKIEALKEERAKAQAELVALRQVRVQIIEELKEAEISIERSCNDQGALYGSVTQRDISDALQEAGFGVDGRSVRLNHPIRRIGTYQVNIQFEKELGTEITLLVKADHELEGYTATGDLIETDESAEGEDAAEGEREPMGSDDDAGEPKRHRKQKKA